MNIHFYGSLYKAAKKLYISPQGLSRGIKKLEEDLGQSLFDRTKIGLTPTPLSDALYQRAKKLTEDFDELYSVAINFKSRGRNTINFGLLGYNAITDAFRLAAEDYVSTIIDSGIIPNVFEASQYEDMYKKLDDGELDIVWSFHTEQEKKYNYYSFKRSPVKCLMSKDSPLSKKESLYWDDLSNQKFIVAGQRELYPRLIDEQCKKYGFSINAAYYSLDSVYMSQLISQGKAVSLLFFEYIDKIRLICPDIVIRTVNPPVFMTASVITSVSNETDDVKNAALYISGRMQRM